MSGYKQWSPIDEPMIVSQGIPAGIDISKVAQAMNNQNNATIFRFVPIRDQEITFSVQNFSETYQIIDEYMTEQFGK